MKTNTWLRRLFARILLVLPFVSQGAMAATPPAHPERAIDRVAEIRQRLLEREGSGDATGSSPAASPETSDRYAQWGNWRNWPNYWANWPNWGNWGNWRDF